MNKLKDVAWPTPPATQERQHHYSLRYRKNPRDGAKPFGNRIGGQTTRNASPSGGRPILQLWRWITVVASWIWHAIASIAEASRGRQKLEEDEDFVRTIQLAFVIDDGGSQQEVLRFARAKFDTGNPLNLISPDFARSFGVEIDHDEEQVKLSLPGNGEFVSIKSLEGRWAAQTSRPGLFFDPRFYDDKFEVSNVSERFDVVIGSQTICRERLMTVRPQLGLAGFLPRVHGSTPPPHLHNRNPHGDVRNSTYEGIYDRTASPQDEQQQENDRTDGYDDCATTSQTGRDCKFEQRAEDMESQDEHNGVDIMRNDHEFIDDGTISNGPTKSPTSYVSSVISEREQGSLSPVSASSSDSQDSSISSDQETSDTSSATTVEPAITNVWLRDAGREEFIQDWLDNHINSYGSSNRQQSGSSNEASRINAMDSSKGSRRLQKGPRKRQLNEDDPEENDDDDDGQRSPRRRIGSPANDQSGRQLACVFAKNNPLQYARCFEYCFKNINRLRQHLERRHYAPIHCPRCSEEFEDEKELNDHIRSVPVCPISPSQEYDGINKEKQKALKKLRASRNKSTEENWNEIYRLLFPESPLPMNPWAEDFRMSHAIQALGEFATSAAPSLIADKVQSGVPSELRGHEQHVETYLQEAVPAIIRTILATVARNPSNTDSRFIRSVDSPAPSIQSTVATTVDSGYRSRVVAPSILEYPATVEPSVLEGISVVASPVHEEQSTSHSSQNFSSPSSPPERLPEDDIGCAGNISFLTSREASFAQANTDLFGQPSTTVVTFPELFPNTFHLDPMIQSLHHESDGFGGNAFNSFNNLGEQTFRLSPELSLSPHVAAQSDQRRRSCSPNELWDPHPSNLS